MKIKPKMYAQASDGWHVGVLADIEYLGIRKSQFGDQEKARLVFLLNERDPAGEPIQITDLATVSIHQDAKFSEYVLTLTGERPDPNVEFETEPLIGRACRLESKQKLTPKGTYANITNRAALKPGDQAPAIPLNFVRAENRTKAKPNGRFKTTKPATNIHGVHVSDEDVIFPGDSN